MTTVGVIGLGKMGLPIARNLMAHGFDVVGYQRRGTAELEAHGGTGAGSPREVAASADVLLSILPDDAALGTVLDGPDGALAALRSTTVHIEMSTLDVTAKSRRRDAVVAAGGDMLDCPISGTPAMVLPRAATTFVSGALDSVDRVRPVLDAISGPWVYAGAFGMGARLKYVANLLVGIHTAAAAEAVVLARRSGLDVDLVLQTLDGSIGSSMILSRRGPLMRDRSWEPAPGPIATLYPILEQIEHQATALDLRLPVFEAAKSLFADAMTDGWGDLDIAAVHDRLTASGNAS